MRALFQFSVLLTLLAALYKGSAFKVYLTESVPNQDDSPLSPQLTDEQLCMDRCFRKAGSQLRMCRDRCVTLTQEPSTPALKRQLMPLHSCLEAKCLGVATKNYLGCMLQKCIYSGRMKGKRSWDDNDRACILFHCPNLDPYSMEYHVCTHVKCNQGRKR